MIFCFTFPACSGLKGLVISNIPLYIISIAAAVSHIKAIRCKYIALFVLTDSSVPAILNLLPYIWVLFTLSNSVSIISLVSALSTTVFKTSNGVVPYPSRDWAYIYTTGFKKIQQSKNTLIQYKSWVRCEMHRYINLSNQCFI